MRQLSEALILDQLEGTRLEEAVKATPHSGGHNETLAQVTHDAQNMVTALSCYCELLEEPGVLAAPHRHYAEELKMVAAASRRLMERLLTLHNQATARAKVAHEAPSHTRGLSLVEPAAKSVHAMRYRIANPPKLISDLAWELQMSQNLLAAVAGRAIKLTVSADGGALPVWMPSEDLTRILVNLVKNSVEAMPAGGAIHLSVRELACEPGETHALLLAIEDNGPGIPPETMELIFKPGFTTRSGATKSFALPAAEHRGLGLSMTHTLVEAAGGRIQAVNREAAGACFEIELPVRPIQATVLQ